MAASMRSDVEEEQWLNAAIQILHQAKCPLHYTNIKLLIAEKGLISTRLKTTLEAALCKEAQSICGRICLVDGQPGVFTLMKTGKKPAIRSFNALSEAAYLVPPKPPMTEAVKYQEKYRRLKRHVKELIFSNAAYCDEVFRIEEKVVRVKEERRYLLRRLLQYQAGNTAVPETAHLSTSCATSASSMHAVPNSAAYQMLPVASANHNTQNARPTSQSIAQLLGEVDKRRKKNTSKKRSMNGSVQAGEDGRTGTVIPVRNSKKSRLTNTKRRVAPIPLDASGRPVFPIELGSLTVYCLGEIVPLPGYYSTENIYPVGFCSTRSYVSIKGSSSTCLYTCKISDGGSAAKFEISQEDIAEKKFTGSTLSECQQQLLDAINASRGVGTVPSDCNSGAEFFGLSHPTVQNLIQSCPGARKCANYRWTKFEVSRINADVHVEDNPAVNASLLKSATGASSAATTTTVPVVTTAAAAGINSTMLMSMTALTPQQEQQQQLAIESLLCEQLG